MSLGMFYARTVTSSNAMDPLVRTCVADAVLLCVAKINVCLYRPTIDCHRAGERAVKLRSGVLGNLSKSHVVEFATLTGHGSEQQRANTQHIVSIR